MSSYIMLLRSPEQALSSGAEELVKANLYNLLCNFESVVFDDIQDAWLDSSWATQATDYLFDSNGDPRWFGDEDVLHDLMRNSTQRVHELAEESSAWMAKLIDVNFPILMEVAEHFAIDSATVARRFANQWVVKVVGERYG